MGRKQTSGWRPADVAHDPVDERGEHIRRRKTA
jgi:hypothetical protein